MDLSELNLEERADNGAVLVLRHPVTGEELTHDGGPITITLAGIDSERYRSKQREIQQRKIERAQRGKKYELLDSDDERAEIVAACTLAWERIVYKGEALECNYANALLLYRAQRWLLSQADSFVLDRANFFRD